MKIELEREELQQIVAAHIGKTFGGEWACDGSDYNWPRTATFEQQTPELVAKKAEEEAAAKRALAEWEEKQKAQPTVSAPSVRDQEQAAA